MSVFIVGAGWLGQPLAKHLMGLKLNTIVSKTSAEGVQQLSELGIPCQQFQFSNSEIEADSDTGTGTGTGTGNSIDKLTQLFITNQIETVIGSFPPGFRKGAGTEYATYWQQLTAAAKKASVKKIIMVSSTTVYPSAPKTLHEDEASLTLSQGNEAFSDNARVMLKAEDHVIQSGLDFTIVRCSGLVGPNRHPSRFASKLKQVSSEAPANMLHLYDAIGIVAFAINHASRTVINATTPETVSKARYYQAALESVGSTDPLPPIVAIPDKRISADKIVSLGYQFHFQSTLEALYD